MLYILFLQNFLYKCLGVVLRKIGTTDFIREHLNLIFSTVDHNNQVQREGCAVGVGFCAASHLDQCLMKLEEVTKTQMVRKATGFMGLMKVFLILYNIILNLQTLNVTKLIKLILTNKVFINSFFFAYLCINF